jgi:4-hydroxythreonine-4-phosphate dehydrogenase
MSTLDLVITPGDPESIGPEVTAKAIHSLGRELKGGSLVVFGSRAPFKRFSALIKTVNVSFIEPPERTSPGYQSAWAVQTATEFVLAAPRSRALVTGPISKERIQAAGFKYKGHTDFLADLTRTSEVTMMLANDLFRVALVTNHCPLGEVASKITSKNLERTIRHAANYCKINLGKKNPKVAILGLNPHAGEGGLLGSEEKKVILPTLLRISKKSPELRLSGPFPADSFFAIESKRPDKSRYDIIVAQYHDQGLIPVKLSDFSKSMNMTLGLPIIRTSVDHGTAFDIAGKNKADPGSMIYAIKNALFYLQQRKKT